MTKLRTKTWYIFMNFVTTKNYKWKLYCFFLCLPLKRQGNCGKLAKFLLVVREPRKNLGKMTKRVVRNSEISREDVEIFWWSTNRGKIFQVVRESEKVENRCARAN